MNIKMNAPLCAGAAVLACLSPSGASAEEGFTIVDGDKGKLSIYGTLDGGFLSRSGNNGAYAAQAGTRFAGHKSELTSGIESESRLGFKGSRDLRNGVSVFFQLEAGFAIDDGKSTLSDAEGNSVFRRKSFIGLTGQPGTVVMGRIDGGRYSVAGKYDPFANGTVANMASIQVHGTRADNAVAYISPAWNGLSFLAAYTTSLVGQESPGNKGDGRLWAFIPSYSKGGLDLTLDIEQLQAKGSEEHKLNILVAGGAYDFGPVKLHAYWESIKTDNYKDIFDGSFATYSALLNHRSWMLGASAPVLGDKAKIRASYVVLDDKTSLDASCRKWGLGGVYYLSERSTYVYADVAKINNSANGICSIQPNPARTAVDSGGTGSPAGGYGTTGFDFGISHSF
ncbi:MAG: porin [Zoogloea oleivorans]|jgi:predicted porin|uniref:porin n=1 Tax=Zoogloea oleivorans TaxID=1552750 RepID=UPI002A35FDBF|nr:porin [Zoogloea oleivorans]MDY0037992.1 porin [Zoogloea oleivorans]